MLSRIAFLRIVGVIAVLTVGGVAGAKMRHHNGSVASDIQLAAAIAPADASAATSGVEISGHAMFPLGVARGIPSYSESHAAATHAAVVDHLPDLDQLRTAGRSPAIVFGPGANSRAGGSSSAFGGHGFAGAGASFGSIGMGGGRAPQTTSTKTSAPAAVKTTPAPKAPSAPAPRAPSAAPAAPPVAPAIPPAVVPPTVAAPSLTAPAVVAPPIFATETTPIPVIAGDPPKANPAPLAGPVGGGGSVAAKGPNLSPTPEPASLLLIATGLAVVIGASRRRQTKP